MNKRDAFSEDIRKGLIGPGSDVFEVPDTQELISDYPLNRYYSGILFPNKTYSGGNTVPTTESEQDEAVVIAAADDQGYVPEQEHTVLESDAIANESGTESQANKDDYDQARVRDFEQSQNTFFPTHIGLTFCVADTKPVQAAFSFGLYYQLNQPNPDIKIAISKEGFDSFFSPEIETPLSFTDALVHEDGYMRLTRALQGSITYPRSGEYKNFDQFKTYRNIGPHEAYRHIHLLEKLLGRIWRRRELNFTIPVEVGNTTAPVVLHEEHFGKEQLEVSYATKHICHGDNHYLKILLINTSRYAADKFANTNFNLNQLSLFQATIGVEGELMPYKSVEELHPFDEEQNEIAFIYREVKSFGVGHNCSAQWDVESSSGTASEIHTTFLPEKTVFGMKNDFSAEDFPKDFERLNQTLELKRLSFFAGDTNAMLEGLQHFAGLYEAWIEKQNADASSTSAADRAIADAIVKRQCTNLDRIKRGIHILRTNPRALRCFHLANAAMFIQMIIAGDNRLGKYERELTDVPEDVSSNSLDFFEGYNDWHYTNAKGEPPRYRPFQLAFLLLSLEGIIDDTSPERNEVVDLIWFPTGGGKTEAYLAVSAFAILWRRLANSVEAAKGTSIIMRYTLRLLTAQQFERASRLILALEFLRRNLQDELGQETVSIGLWVGQGASPNTIDAADTVVSKVLENPAQAAQHSSKLQLSSCPWCGTKLVTKNAKDRWACGYESATGANGFFRFKCVNAACAYYKGLPVQVVDEMLYRQPPTLLFATVDKFANLAGQRDGLGHQFFNRFSDALPPDLIIQDELHLISGPLGSIVGIFEGVVDFLCTKNGRQPKIISSTATTRNTGSQIGALYGGKRVNIFPPSGMSYRDSFFARETPSKRKYIGFMPTGKTAVSTQLWLLPHLLLTRVRLYEAGQLSALDLYWTVVSYYNSLKDVGKIYNKVNDEVQTNLNTLFFRFYGNNAERRFLINGIDDRTIELTSRWESENIKGLLKKLEDEISTTTSERGTTYIGKGLDLVLASNMISVGIDVGRLNVMLVNGMPRNIAEYIQASSRVGRKHEGLVVSLFNPAQARDKSYFENFNSFHQAYYRFVEPISVTPFTDNTIHKMLTTVMVAFLRNSVQELNADNAAKNFRQGHGELFREYIHERFGPNRQFDALLDELVEDWLEKIRRGNGALSYSKLLRKPSSNNNSGEERWLTMNSLRDIDSETYFRINNVDNA